MEEKQNRMSKEEQAFHRKADAEIDLLDRIQQWCYGYSGYLGIGNLNHSDEVIAENVEAEFGISAKLILEEFIGPDNCNFSTYELIERAWKKQNSLV